jgi:hypothetical protein
MSYLYNAFVTFKHPQPSTTIVRNERILVHRSQLGSHLIRSDRLNNTPNFDPLRFHQYRSDFNSDTHVLFAHSSAITHAKIASRIHRHHQNSVGFVFATLAFVTELTHHAQPCPSSERWRKPKF